VHTQLMLPHNVKYLYRVIVLIVLSILNASCGKEKEIYTNPVGYDLTRPYKLAMPLELDEISGVAYYALDSSIMAINDELGWLYKVHPSNVRRTEKWHFSHGDDFEDIVLIDSIFYALKSNGNIISFHFRSDSIIGQEHVFALGTSEFETLYQDTVSSDLVLICKDCESDKKKLLSVFLYNRYTGLYSKAPFDIDAKRIAELLGKKSIRFKPSAAAIHPITGELYIVSAVNKLLVISDVRGNVLAAHRLDPSVFKQPEGLCFTPSGSLIISNESAGNGLANILIYKYQPSKTN
jgi:hypothetical protein